MKAKLLAGLPLIVPGVLALLLVAGSGPGLLAMKTIAFLLMPAGLIWLALLGLIFWPGLSRTPRAILVSLWLVYSVIGNGWFGAWLIGTLEEPFAGSINELREREDLPLDAIFVLGGGTLRSPDGSPSLGLAGDRVVVPVRLFKEGLTQNLVASGRSITEASGQPRLLSDDTAAIWIAFGVPDEQILRISEPVNTEGEIEAYASMIEEKGWKRVGLCTSAWHLPRALGLAEDRGVDFHPIPADFLGQTLPIIPMYAIPQTKGFRRTQTALWEYLGQIKP